MYNFVYSVYSMYVVILYKILCMFFIYRILKYQKRRPGLAPLSPFFFLFSLLFLKFIWPVWLSTLSWQHSSSCSQLHILHKNGNRGQFINITKSKNHESSKSKSPYRLWFWAFPYSSFPFILNLWYFKLWTCDQYLTWS